MGGDEGDFVEFTKSILTSEMQSKRSIFDISVTSQKSSPFSRTAQNELAKELYSAGLFNPNNSVSALVCLNMMDFDGKEEVISKIIENSSNQNTINYLMQKVEKLTELVNRAYGTNVSDKPKSKNLLETITKTKKPSDYRLDAIRKNLPLR